MSNKLILKIRNDGDSLDFICENKITMYRAKTLYSKEPGTIEWIKKTFKEGDTFYDIGANMGVYTLYANKYLGKTGHTYSFEPHPANTSLLLQNIVRNNMQDTVTMLPCGVYSSDGFQPFKFLSDEPGSSGHQISENSSISSPTATALIMTVTVDHLIESNIIKPPTHVKIDIDGQELNVLNGMKKLLSGPSAPKTMQIEIDPKAKEGIEAFMEEHGYKKTSKHYTQSKQALVDEGADKDSLIYNQIFSKGNADE